MKKIINGKRYDTESAQELGSHWNGYHNFSTVTETLYIKRTGEYFLHGYGGPMSKYAEHYGDCLTDGNTIIPMSYDEAREWAEQHLTADEYEECFPVAADEEADSADIASVIRASGMSLKQVSDHFGIPYRTLQNWAGGVNTPPAYVTALLAAALNIKG